jgi:hypothetical protein
MSSMDVYEAALRMIERYGFGLILATAILWFVRTDLVLPMVEAHQQFLKEMSTTQHDISRSIQEQTRILYTLAPREARSGGPDTEGTN